MAEPVTAARASDPRRTSTLAIALLPAAAAFLSRLSALRGGWVWDDLLILRNQLGAFRSPGDLFFPPAGIPGFSIHYYRPLVVLSFLADRALFGERAWGYHLTVLLLHAAAATALFFLARSFCRAGAAGDLSALAAALLFAVHPTLTESVAWLAGRSDLLATLFLLAAALALRRRPLSALSLAAAAGLFALACLAKEIAYGFLPLAPILAAGGAERRPREGSAASLRGGEGARLRDAADGGGAEDPSPGVHPALATLVLAAVAGATIFMRLRALGGLGGEPPLSGLVGSVRGVGGALAFYLPRAVLPLAPAPFEDAVPTGLAAWAGLASAALLSAAAVALLARAGTRPAGLGIAGFFCFLAPSLAPSVANIGSAPVAERYLYAPMAALALTVAVIAQPAFVRRMKLGITFLAAAVALLGALSFSRARIWHDDISLWTAAASRAHGPFPSLQLAVALGAEGRGVEAEAIYEHLLADESRLSAKQRSRIRTSLGVLYARRGLAEKASDAYEESVRIDPSNALGWYNAASVRCQRALFDPPARNGDDAAIARCVEAVHRAHELARLDAPVLLLLGRVEAALGHAGAAREAWQQAASIDPTGHYGSEARALLSQSR